MPSTTYTAHKSSLFAYRELYGYHLGGGRDDHLVVGYYGSGSDRYRFRAAIGIPPIDWDGITVLESAILTLHRSGNVHIVPGGSPRLWVERAVTPWEPNTQRSAYDSPAGSGWTTEPDGWPGPAGTAVGRAEQVPSGDTIAIDVTAIVRAWAPATVQGGGGELQRGLVLRASAELDSSRNWECYSAYSNVSSALRPSLEITYDTAAPNDPPLAPALGPGMAEDPPMIELDASDPNAGDTLASYDVQVKLASVSGWDPDDLEYNETGLTAGITGWSVDTAYAGDAFETGTAYRWRARVRDQDGAVSPWSASVGFIADAGAWDAWDQWARFIIDALADPVPDRELGTIYPEDDEIRAVLTTDYRERWRIIATTRAPDVDVTAALYGLTFELEYPEVRAIAVLGDFEPTYIEPAPEPPAGACGDPHTNDWGYVSSPHTSMYAPGYSKTRRIYATLVDDGDATEVMDMGYSGAWPAWNGDSQDGHTGVFPPAHLENMAGVTLDLRNLPPVRLYVWAEMTTAYGTLYTDGGAFELVARIPGGSTDTTVSVTPYAVAAGSVGPGTPLKVGEFDISWSDGPSCE